MKCDYVIKKNDRDNDHNKTIQTNIHFE